MKFTIPFELPGLNEIIGEARKNRYKSAAQKKEYTNAITWIVKKVPKMNYIDVAIVWYCKDKRRDKDNIMGGQKYILDSLVAAGVIKNDGWSEINNITHKFYIDKSNPRVEVELLEVKPQETI